MIQILKMDRRMGINVDMEKVDEMTKREVTKKIRNGQQSVGLQVEEMIKDVVNDEMEWRKKNVIAKEFQGNTITVATGI